MPITIPEAIQGATVEVPTLNGSKRIRVQPGTQHGTVQRLRGEGPPKPGGRGRGDIRYRLGIEVPSDLTDEQRRRSASSRRRSTTATRASGCCAMRPRSGRRVRGRQGRRVSASAKACRPPRDGLRIDADRGVFMISVAAELAEMHPQTLRMYEARGLITPKRSPKNTRLYSQEDVERLRRIQRLTADEGLNLAGVEAVLQLEERLKNAGELGGMRGARRRSSSGWRPRSTGQALDGRRHRPLRRL